MLRQLSPERPRAPVVGVGALRITERAKTLVLGALNNNRLSYGPLTRRFEKEFADAHECRFGIMTNSGTSALQVALQAMKELHGWSDGDEVIVPAVTFVATVNVVLHNRMQPVLVDVHPQFYDLDPELLEAAITPRTRAVIPVHVFGQPADMEPICDIAQRRGLKIIEDSCETMFAAYQGRRVGGFGEIACFSTYVAHLLVTGVGGLATTNNPEYAVRMRSLVNHGRDSIYLNIDDDQGQSDEELHVIVARRFRFTSIGHSFRATELQAALGLAQFEEWESIIKARRANARSLVRKLQHLESKLQLPRVRDGSESSFMMFPMVLREEPKGELVDFLERRGVETRSMLPITNQPVYQDLLGWREDTHPVAKWINERGFYVGSHQELTGTTLDYMAELIEAYCYRQQARAVGQGACLVLSSDDPDIVSLRALLHDVPVELFERVVVVESSLTDDARAWIERKGLTFIRGDQKRVLSLVLDSEGGGGVRGGRTLQR